MSQNAVDIRNKIIDVLRAENAVPSIAAEALVSLGLSVLDDVLDPASFDGKDKAVILEFNGDNIAFILNAGPVETPTEN